MKDFEPGVYGSGSGKVVIMRPGIEIHRISAAEYQVVIRLEGFTTEQAAFDVAKLANEQFTRNEMPGESA